jgi:hypothetical protein
MYIYIHIHIYIYTCVCITDQRKDSESLKSSQNDAKDYGDLNKADDVSSYIL